MIIKKIKALILNGVAHYNMSNRLEYLGLIFRMRQPRQIIIQSNKPFELSGIYVVSMTASADRREFICAQMLEQQISYEFIDATVGRAFDCKLHAISSRSLEYLTSGSVGCWVSHYRTWQKIKDSNKINTVVIEDDVLLDKDFLVKINNCLWSVPDDFDILFLNTGNNCRRNQRYFVNKHIFVPYQIRNGTYGYVISSVGADKLLKLVPNVQVTRGGIDSAIGSLIRDGKIAAYHLVDPLCWVDFSFKSFTKN